METTNNIISKKIKKNENKEKIISTASRLISKKGIDGTSLSDIAIETGLSKGTLYYYYSTKDALIIEVADRHLNKLYEDIIAVINQSRQDFKLVTFLEQLYETVSLSKKRAKIDLSLIHGALVGNEVLKQKIINKYFELKKILKDELKGILIDDIADKINYDILFQLTIIIIDGLFIHKSLGIDDLSTKKIADYLSKQI